MPPLKISIRAALGSMVLTVAGLYFFHQNRNREADRLRDENNRVRFQINQHEHARASAVSPSLSDRGGAKIIERNSTPAVVPIVGDYRNEGQGTPLAVMQTFAWACDRGDTATMEKLLWFEGEGREKAKAFMASLPDNARGPWTSPEAMAAAVYIGDALNNPFPSATLLEKAEVVQLREDRVVLKLPGTVRDRSEYQKTEGVWKWVITEAVVDDYVNRSTQNTAGR